MAARTNITGKKATKSHTSFIQAAAPVVKFLDKSPLVNKYALSIITPGRSKKRRIKISAIQGGIKLVVYGNIYLQDIYVYTDSAEALKSSLTKKLGAKFIIQLS